MEEISLAVPRGVVESLPEDDGTAEKDLRQAVAGIESRVNERIAAATDASDAASDVLDVIEHLDARMERYDEFVPELRAWGQSPIYAIAWRNCYAELIAQLYENEWLADELDRERNYRVVDDGIRFGGT